MFDVELGCELFITCKCELVDFQLPFVVASGCDDDSYLPKVASILTDLYMQGQLGIVMYIEIAWSS